jgi:sortase (surface protein transpeptidase)
MANRFDNFFRNPTNRRYVRIAAFVVLGMSIGALVTNIVLFPQRYLPDHVNVTPIKEEPLGAHAYTLPRSEPVELSIPKIHLDTTFVPPLGLQDNGEPEVPNDYTQVGWYKYSPTPGELGPSIIFGHVDSYQGAAVFYLIGQLERGDPIYVTRADGSVATFRVTGIGRYEQSKFPTDLVYGDINHAGLRLVTCSGTYNHETLRYDHNTVVYASLEKATTTLDSTATSASK